jgi:hypothetical protein
MAIIRKTLKSTDTVTIKDFVMFIISISLLLNNNFIQDAAPGDSGAPLYTLGDSSRPGEISGRYLIGIHSGGKDEFVATRLQRGNVFFPKWWIRVSLQRSLFS